MTLQRAPRAGMAATRLAGLRPSRGIRYMFLAAFFFSLMTVCVKLIGSRLPAAEVVFVRSIISVVITAGMMRRAGVRTLGRRKGLLLARGIVGFLALLCFFYAIPRLPLADVTVIQYSNPVYVALLASVFLSESVRGREGVGLLLSIAGVVVIARPTFLLGNSGIAMDPMHVLIAMGGAVGAAIAYVLVRKLRETEHHLVVVLYFPLVSIFACLPLLLSGAVWPTPREWLLLGAIGLITQVAQVYMTLGLHAERAARATSVSYVQILFGALWGILFFGELPDVWLAVGGGLIMVALAIVSWDRSAPRQAPASGP